MLIKAPCIITARLLPGIKIGNDSYLSIEYTGNINQDNRDIYRVYLDTPDFEHVDETCQSGCGGGTLQQGLSSALSFMGACAESVNYARRTGRQGDNADLSPKHVAEWLAQNEDELSIAQCLLDETPDAIEK